MSTNVSLSIAIKNSIILALVILIAHFLLKTPKDDEENVPSRVPPPSLHAKVDESPVKGEDLYSYVYGGRKQGGELAAGPSPPPAPCHAVTSAEAVPQSPLDRGCGDLMAYEGGGTSDQWCML